MCTNIVFGVVKVKITRRINNNLVQVDDRGTAKIIVGCGVGFNAHPGDKIDWAQVEQVSVQQHDWSKRLANASCR